MVVAWRPWAFILSIHPFKPARGGAGHPHRLGGVARAVPRTGGSVCARTPRPSPHACTPRCRVLRVAAQLTHAFLPFHLRRLTPHAVCVARASPRPTGRTSSRRSAASSSPARASLRVSGCACLHGHDAGRMGGLTAPWVPSVVAQRRRRRSRRWCTSWAAATAPTSKSVSAYAMRASLLCPHL